MLVYPYRKVMAAASSALVGMPANAPATPALYLRHSANLSTTLWKDQSGNGKDAVLQGTAAPSTISGTTGVLCNNGGNGNVIVNSTFGLTNVVSMCVRANFSSANLSGCLLKIGSTNDGYGVGVGNSTFDDVGNHIIGLMEVIAWRGTSINIGTGLHSLGFMLVSGSPYLQLYVDGVSVDNYYMSAPYSPAGGVSYIGGYSTRLFSGIVTDVAVYPRGLSSTEWTALHNAMST